MNAEAAQPSPALLKVPVVPAATYSRNFLKQAVCELRFPTLFELEGPKPPSTFAAALRKDYPVHQVVTSVGLNQKDVTRDNVHTFRAKGDRWVVTLKANAVVLETSKYESLDDFLVRLSIVLKAALPVIDSDFFTRIGLRYINEVDIRSGLLSDWINPALVGPLSDGTYGAVAEHVGRVVGSTPHGAYVLQHGCRPDASFATTPRYSLDFDLSSEDVLVGEAIEQVKKLHDQAFNFFHWALGPAAKNFLGIAKENK